MITRLPPSILYVIELLTLDGWVKADSTVTVNPSIDINDPRVVGGNIIPTMATVTIGTNVYAVDPTNIAISSHTIFPGGPSATVDGEASSEDVSHDLMAAVSTVYEFHRSNSSTRIPKSSKRTWNPPSPITTMAKLGTSTKHASTSTFGFSNGSLNVISTITPPISIF